MKIPSIILSALAALGITSLAVSAPTPPSPSSVGLTVQTFGLTNNDSSVSSIFPKSNTVFYATFTPFLGDPANRPDKDFNMLQAVSPDGLHWLLAGSAPAQDHSGGLNTIDTPCTLLYTNAAYPHGIWLAALYNADNRSTNFWQMQTSTDWQHWHYQTNVTLNALNITAAGGPNLTADATNVLHMLMNVFTNHWEGNWACVEQHVTNHNASVDKWGWSAPTLLALANASPYDPFLYIEGGTNWIAYSQQNQIGIAYSIGDLATATYTTVSDFLFSGQGPSIQKVGGVYYLWSAPALSGMSLYRASSLFGPWAFIGQQTLPLVMQRATVRQVSSDKERSDIMGALATAAPLNFALLSSLWTSDIMINGRSGPTSLGGSLTVGADLVVSSPTSNSTLAVSNNLRFGVSTISSNITISFNGTPLRVVDYSTAALTITLPGFPVRVGRELRFDAFMVGGSTNAVTFQASGQTVNGRSSLVLTGTTWTSATFDCLSNNTWSAAVSRP